MRFKPVQLTCCFLETEYSRKMSKISKKNTGGLQFKHASRSSVRPFKAFPSFPSFEGVSIKCLHQKSGLGFAPAVGTIPSAAELCREERRRHARCQKRNAAPSPASQHASHCRIRGDTAVCVCGGQITSRGSEAPFLAPWFRSAFSSRLKYRK